LKKTEQVVNVTCLGAWRRIQISHARSLVWLMTSTEINAHQHVHHNHNENDDRNNRPKWIKWHNYSRKGNMKQLGLEFTYHTYQYWRMNTWNSEKDSKLPSLLKKSEIR
jgi:hypothetical protein